MWMLSRREQGFESMEDWWGKPYDVDSVSKLLPGWRWSLEVLWKEVCVVCWRKPIIQLRLGGDQRFQ